MAMVVNYGDDYQNNNSFLRRLVVALSSYFWDTLYIPHRKGGDIRMVNVPIYYSVTGDYSLLIDLFTNNDEYCNNLGLNGGSTINSYPSGVFSFKSVSIAGSDRTGKFERGIFDRQITDDYGSYVKTMNSTINWLPLNISMELMIRANNASERFKVWEAFIKQFYNTREFWMRYDGISKIPVMIKIADNSAMPRSFSFHVTNSDANYYEFNNGMDIITWMPIIDDYNTRENDNRFSPPSIGFKEKE